LTKFAKKGQKPRNIYVINNYFASSFTTFLELYSHLSLMNIPKFLLFRRYKKCHYWLYNSVFRLYALSNYRLR